MLEQEEKRMLGNFINNDKKRSLATYSEEEEKTLIIKIPKTTRMKKLIKKLTDGKISRKYFKQKFSRLKDILIINQELELNELNKDIMNFLIENSEVEFKFTTAKVIKELKENKDKVDEILRTNKPTNDDEVLNALYEDSQYYLVIRDQYSNDYKVYFRTDGLGPDCFIIKPDDTFIRTPYGRKRKKYYSLQTAIASCSKKVDIKVDKVFLYSESQQLLKIN